MLVTSSNLEQTMVQKGVNIGMNHDVRRDGMEELIMQV
jgi:hypothetical protein